MKVKVIKMANTNKRYEPEFKKRWSGWYQKKDEPSQASIKSMAQEKELSGAGSDSLKKNAKRYNCSIIDLYDKSVLATLNSKRIDAELAIQTLQIALDRNPVKGEIILHSDQGSQYTSRAFTEFCEGKGIQQSMSKAGCPYDNSPMESFYGTFKSEFIRQNRFETDQELNESTLDYVYGYYNHIRPHSSNGYMTPFEKRYSNQ